MAGIGATAEVDRYSEAIDWFTKRTVISADAARALDARLKVESFWIGGGLQLTQIQRVFDEIGVALEKGEPFEDWRARVRAELRSDTHAETVFRNAAQRAYNAGRWEQMTEPSVARFRPFWLFDAVLDSRTTTICRDADGTLLPADDPWWLTNWPPRHHRCRSGVRNLRRSEAERRGIKPPPPSTASDRGFGAAPAARQPWKPDPAKHDPKLVAELDRKAEQGAKKRKPATPAAHKPSHWEKRYRKRYGDAAPALAHGRASLERGLDMKVPEALALLDEIELPGGDRMREAITFLAGTRTRDATLREIGAEIEPMGKAAAAVAGHLRSLPKKRPQTLKLTHPTATRDPRAARVAKFFARMSHPQVKQPTDWLFARNSKRSFCRQGELHHVTLIGELEHEWGHAIEKLNPVALKRATAFLETRIREAKARGERLEKLSKLLNSSGYSASEKAWRDEFAFAYMGKEYRHLSGPIADTELTPMGVEMLAAGHRSHLNLDQLAAQDTDHLLFTLGQLAGK